MKNVVVINTSEHDWLNKTVRIRLAFGEVQLNDDASVGVEQEDIEQLLNLIRLHQDSRHSQFRVLLGVSVGILLSAMGLWMIHEAVIDDEQTSSLWMLLAGECSWRCLAVWVCFMPWASAGVSARRQAIAT